jgi:3-oxoacyl-[acyl-carrier protein] reductase
MGHANEKERKLTQYPDLAGKTVLITGSSKALGAETARAFARQGARVVVHGRDQRAIARVTDSIRAENGECIGLAADLTQADQIEGLRTAIKQHYGDLDILACFAGGMGQPIPVLDIDEARWRQTLDIDLTAKFLTVRAFAPSMRSRGHGNIILMSSAAGRLISQASAVYGAAQAATLMFMRHLAQELGPAGVRVNAVAPAITCNEKIERAMSAELQQRVAESLPLRRLGEPRDIASAALFLASEASSWITGHTLDVAGGKIML